MKQNTVQAILDNIFDSITIIISATLIIRHQLDPYGADDIGEMATWILAVLGLLAVSSVWHYGRYLRRSEQLAGNTNILVKEVADTNDQFKRGILAVREKYFYSKVFWQSVLQESTQEFDLLGHALMTWCEEPYATEFARQLKYIADSGGTIRIVILNSNGENHVRRRTAIGKSYEYRIDTTLRFLKKEVIARVKERKRENVMVRQDSYLDFPYMLIRTEKQVRVSPYLARTDSKDNLLLSFEASSKYAMMYANDFEKIFEKAKPVIWTEIT